MYFAPEQENQSSTAEFSWAILGYFNFPASNWQDELNLTFVYIYPSPPLLHSVRFDEVIASEPRQLLELGP